MLSLPLDILHGDDGGFMGDLMGLFPGLSGMSPVSSDMADKLHDNDFSMIIMSKGGPGMGMMKNRFFPRHDPLHGLSSLVSLLKNKDYVEPSTAQGVGKKIIIALPKEYASSDFVQKILQGLGISVDNPEAVEGAVGGTTTENEMAECGPDKDKEEVLEHAISHQGKCPMCGHEMSECGDPMIMDEEKIKPCTTVKESSARKHYLLDSGDSQYMEITTDEQIKTAAAYMNKEARRVDARVYGVMYENLVNRMIQTGMSPKEAGLEDIRINEYVRGELIKRANYVAPGEKREAYFNLYHQIDKLTPVKLASVITELDEATGINKLYARRMVQTPIDAVMSNIKIAEDLFVYNDPQTGNKVTAFQLEEASKSKSTLREIQKFLGEDMREAMESSPVSAFKHLPDMHKGIIAKILADRSLDMSGDDSHEESKHQETDQPARDGSLVITEDKV